MGMCEGRRSPKAGIHV